ncbi:MAG: response regulator transcription factor [Magnetococcales bacterium]|nr:response regulator transcription factor [Magnetococcales bacterium]MBF0148473.1 response regulator transcription factor [Magnetococcales bacterium]MBF0172622.1 response regulator transcription factor [Magnetococcales bacterium]MBF0347546.1 response regulator transcription factor [Magnetococcales bacterium]MBF0629929.1 response regulator transcription factor [Magnetococcales bacterium]
MIRILVVDDHKMFRKGLVLILEDAGDMQVAGEAENGDEAMKMILRQEWDLVLLDVSLPGKSALELIHHTLLKKPQLPILILTMHHDELLAVRFMKAGARGFLTKDSDPALLVQAIRRIVSGHRHISPELAERILDISTDSDPSIPLHQKLSNREFTVMCQIASGKTVGTIAEELGISSRTASTYRSRILEKLHLNNNAELTHYAFKHNLLPGISNN